MVIEKLPAPLRLAANTGLVLAGAAGPYRMKKTTPDWAAQSLIRLFCQTRGYSNDMFHALLTRFHRPYPIQRWEGILGQLSEDDLGTAVTAIRREGYYIFPTRLS